MQPQPATAADAVRVELVANERVLWTGSPDPGTRFAPADRLLVPFTVVWAAMALVIFSTALSQGAPGPFPLFGVVFLAAGSYFVFGRFLFKARRKRRTIYAVTDRRVLIIEQRNGPNRVQSAFLSSLPGLHLRENANGVGTITFGASSMMSNMFGNTGLEQFNWMYPIPMAFYDVPDARRIHDLIMSARTEPPR